MVMKTILIPVDLSAATSRVCKAACALAKLTKARLVLFHVVQLPAVMLNDVYGYDAGELVEFVTTQEKYAARRLRTLARRLVKERFTVRTIERTGMPVAEILKQARSLRADYIVVGSHGHGVAYGLLVGSTTQGVLRKATCPVLVIPTAR
jgi:nucleotide-binding universal stress UspA family protein